MWLKLRNGLLLVVMVLGAPLAVGSAKKSGITDDPFVRTSTTSPSTRQARWSAGPRTEPLPYPPCPAPPGIIERPHLLRILNRSPSVFLKGVELAMVPRNRLPQGGATWRSKTTPPVAGSRGTGAFGGWRIHRFHPGDPCLGRANLRPGDIIASVNGNPLRMPGDLMKAWNGLRQAPRIVVRLYRDGQPLVFVVRIRNVDGSQKH